MSNPFEGSGMNFTRLTKEDLKSLRKTESYNDRCVSYEEEEQTKCFHPDLECRDDKLICAKCGTEFSKYTGTIEDVIQLVDNMFNLLQTIKMYTFHLHPLFISNFFHIEVLLKKIPDLYIDGYYNEEVSEVELYKAFCVHRMDNRFSVTEDKTGDMVCHICGTKFKQFEGTFEDVEDMCNDMLNLLETIKSNRVVRCYFKYYTVNPFMVIAYIRKIPELFRMCQNNRKFILGNNDTINNEISRSFIDYQNMVARSVENQFIDNYPSIYPPCVKYQPQSLSDTLEACIKTVMERNNKE